jgi:hypothetical protein
MEDVALFLDLLAEGNETVEAVPAEDVVHGGSLAEFKFYAEGVVLTPISIFGILGETQRMFY